MASHLSRSLSPTAEAVLARSIVVIAKAFDCYHLAHFADNMEFGDKSNRCERGISRCDGGKCLLHQNSVISRLGLFLADMSCVAENLLILVLVNNLTVWI